jgi:hypothetical protein
VKAWVVVAVALAAAVRSFSLASAFAVAAAAAAYIRRTGQVIVSQFTLALPLEPKPQVGDGGSGGRDGGGGSGGSRRRWRGDRGVAGVASVIAAGIVLTAPRVSGRLGTPPLRCGTVCGRYSSRHGGSPMERGRLK